MSLNVAGILINASLSKEINDSMRLFNDKRRTEYIYRYVDPKETRVPIEVPEKEVEAITDVLATYSLYPQKLKSLTSKNNSALSVMNSAIENCAMLVPSNKYVPQRVVNAINLRRDLEKGAREMLHATWDIERLGLYGRDGKLHTAILEFGFEYMGSGGKDVGKALGGIAARAVNGNMISSGLIGIDDEEFVYQLNALANKIEANPNAMLTPEERLVYRFGSRMGDEGTIIKYTDEGLAYVETLTTKAESEYQNVANLRRFTNRMTDERLFVKGESGLTMGRQEMIKNMAFTASRQVDLVSGNNVTGYDIGNAMEILNQAGMDYYNQIAEPTGLSFSQSVYGKTYDLWELAKHAPREARKQYHDTIYRNGKSIMRPPEFTGYDKQENIVAAWFGDLLDVAHSADADIRNFSRFVMDPKSPVRILEDSILQLSEQTIGMGEALQSLNGTLIQARDSGTLKTLSSYNKNIIATTMARNKDLYLSTGYMRKGSNGQYYRPDQYTPAFFNKDVTYEIVDAGIFDPGTLTDPAFADNSFFRGQPVMHMRIKPYVRSNTPLYEGNSRITDMYFPVSESDEVLGHFGLVATRDANGQYKVTQAAKDRIINSYQRESEVFLPKNARDMLALQMEGSTGTTPKNLLPDDLALDFYYRMNGLRPEDAAERSVNKYSYTTNQQIFRFNRLYSNGKFTDPNANRTAAILEAVEQDLINLNNGDSAFTNVLSIAGTEKTAQDEAIQLAKGFLMNGKDYNAAYASNVAYAGSVMTKGSILEQLHSIVIDQLNTSGISPDEHFRYNNAYTNAMHTLTNIVKSNMTKEARGTRVRPTASEGMFYVDMSYWADLRRSGNVLEDSVTGPIRTPYLGFNLNNPSLTIGAIRNMAKVPENLKNSDPHVRSAVLEAVYNLRNVEELKDQVVTYGSQKMNFGDAIYSMFVDKNNYINRRTSMEIVEEVTGMLQEVQNTNPNLGKRIEEHELTLESALGKPYNIKGTVLEKSLKDAAADSVQRSPKKLEDSAKKLADWMTRELKDVRSSDYTDEMNSFLHYRFQQEQESALGYAKSLVELLHESGGSIQVDSGNRLWVQFNGGEWQEYTSKIVQFQSDTTGAIMHKVGPSGTQHIARGVTRWDNKISNGMQVKHESVVDLARDKYLGKGRRTRTNFTKDLAQGKDKHELLGKVLGLVNKEISVNPTAGTSPALDMLNFFTTDASPLAYYKDLLGDGNGTGRLDKLEAAFADKPYMLKSINQLREYAENVKAGKKPEKAFQFMQKMGLTRVMTDADTPVHLRDSDRVAIPEFTTMYKDSAEGMTLGVGSEHLHLFAGMENEGKGMERMAYNTVYFNTATPRVHDSAVLKDVKMGPFMRSQTEEGLVNYTNKAGTKITNGLTIRTRDITTEAQEAILQQLKQDAEVALKGSSGAYKQAVRNLRIIGKRLNVTAGSGLVNGILTDAYDMAWGSKVVRINDRDLAYAEQELGEKFRKATYMPYGMKTVRGPNGPEKVFRFEYGRGLLQGYNEVTASFKQRFGDTFNETLSNGPVVTTVEYMSKNGRTLMTADAVQRAVEEKLQKKAENIKFTDFITTADQMFERVIVSRPVFEVPNYKLLVNYDKSESGTTTLGFQHLMHNAKKIKAGAYATAEEFLNDPEAYETVIYNALKSKAFDDVFKENKIDVWGGRPLSPSAYKALANMDWSHPIFGKNKLGQADEMEKAIFEQLHTINPKWSFAEMQDIWSQGLWQFRQSAGLAIANVTEGALQYSAMSHEQSRHGSVKGEVENAINYIYNNFTKASTDVNDSIRRLEESVQIFNECNALRDKNDNPIKVLYRSMDANGNLLPESDRGIIIPRVDQYSASAIGRHLSLLSQGGMDEVEILRDINSRLHTGYTTVSLINDDFISRAAMNQTDREISGLSTYIWTADMQKAIEEGIKKDWAENKVFTSKYLTAAEIRHGNMVAEGINEYLIGNEMFARFGDNVESSRRPGSGMRASRKYSYKRVSQKYMDSDPYRVAKMDAIVDNIKDTVGKNAYVSEEYVADMYAVSSAHAARKFNKGEAAIKSLQNDWGKNATGTEYFQLKSFTQDGFTMFRGQGNMLSMGADPLSPLNKNTIWDMTDESIGLTESVLGKNSYVAIAGTNIREMDNGNLAATSPQAKLNKLADLREEVAREFEASPDSEAFKESVERFKQGVQDVKDAVEEFAMGRDSNSLAYRVKSFKTAGSYSGKVNVTGTPTVTPDTLTAQQKLKGKMFKGKSLLEWKEKGRNVNYMIVGEEQFKLMGFDDNYFKHAGISKEKWQKLASTEGIEAVAHRYPSIYLGSDTGIQIYLDKDFNQGEVWMDEITAAAMKADSDGDRAQFYLLGATNRRNGRWYDALSIRAQGNRANKQITKSMVSEVADVTAAHESLMAAQIYYTNDMFKQQESINRTISKNYAEYVKTYKDQHYTDYHQQFLSKVNNKDLANNVFTHQTTMVRREDIEKASTAFFGNRDLLADTLEQSAGLVSKPEALKASIEELRNAQDGEEAFYIFSDILKKHEKDGIREQVWNNLGPKNQKNVNKAFVDVYRAYEPEVGFTQRVMRGGAGMADNPFAVLDVIRMESIVTDTTDNNKLMSARQSTALQVMRESIEEDFLTAKQSGRENIKTIDEIEDFIAGVDKIINGKATRQDKDDLVAITLKHMRDPNERYSAKGALQYWANEAGEIDIESLVREGFDAAETASRALRGQNQYIDEMLQSVSQGVNLANKRRLGSNIWRQKTPAALADTILAKTEGKTAYTGPVNVTRDIIGDINRGAIHVADQKAASSIKDVASKMMSGSWSKNAMLLAGAVMMTGFVGGNPASPPEGQAQRMSENQTPPKSITMADPSLSTSSRKQPGYVININARTQRDKEYASQVIAQSVSRNFQNTNINVAMNVNQQPGNISANEIADYISQSLN